jgi:hypothetical protein
VTIPRRNMQREDEVYAAKLALAGPWGHVNEVLAHRHTKVEKIGLLARRLGVPSWQSKFSNTLQYRELMQWVAVAPGLTAQQRRQARAAVSRMYMFREQRTISHKSRKLVRLALGRR